MAGWGFLTVIRHSLTLPEVNGDDFNRPLSPEGVALASRRYEQLKATKFDLGIVSDRPRTLKTLKIVTPEVKLVHCEPKFFGQDSPKDDALMTTMYKRIGEKPLAEYFAGATKEEFDVLNWFAETRWQMICDYRTKTNAQQIIMVNHAVFAPAMILQGCRPGKLPAALLHRWWKECEGVRLLVHGNYVEDVEPLPELS